MEKKEGCSGLFLLFLVFLILKLTGTITWSWWFVTLPLWIGPALGIAFLGIALGVFLVVGIIVGLIYLINYLYESIRG